MPKLSWFQYVALMVVINLGTTIQTVPTIIAKFTVRSGWIVGIFMFTGVLMSAGITHWFVRVFPGKTMNQAYLFAFGNILGKIIGLWVVLWFYITDCIVFKEAIMFLSDSVLPSTPAFMIGPLMMFVIALVVWFDIEIIARMIEFILPIVFVFFIVFPLSIMNVDIIQLYPLMPDSWTVLWKASVSPIFTYMIEFMVSLMFIDVLPDAKQLSRYILIAGTMTVIIQVAGEFLVTTVLGDASKGLIYPFLEIVQSIRVGKYIERIDVLVILGILTAGFFKVALFNYTLVKSLQEMSFITSKNSVILLSSIAVWAGSLALFPRNSDVLEMLLKFTPSYFVITLLALPILAIVVKILR